MTGLRFVHAACGNEIDSELGYSDAEQDYYFPVCFACSTGLEMRDIVTLQTASPVPPIRRSSVSITADAIQEMLDCTDDRGWRPWKTPREAFVSVIQFCLQRADINIKEVIITNSNREVINDGQ